MVLSPSDTVFVATKHKKEQIVKPLFEREFGCHVDVLEIDTDAYGTFTGEKKRRGAQMDIAKKKAFDAARRFGKRFVLASEGSFFPDPNSFGFLILNVEVVVLYDAHADYFYIGEHVTHDVCAKKSDIRSLNDFYTFIKDMPQDQQYILSYRTLFLLGKKVFIKHALVQQVPEILTSLLSRRGVMNIVIETDMRAHRNALRKHAIQKATEKLIEHLRTVSA